MSPPPKQSVLDWREGGEAEPASPVAALAPRRAGGTHLI